MIDLQTIDNVDIIQSSLKSLLEDPENGTIDSSLPPSLLLILEQVRTTLQEQQDTIKKSNTLTKSVSKDAQQGKEEAYTWYS